MPQRIQRTHLPTSLPNFHRIGIGPSIMLSAVMSASSFSASIREAVASETSSRRTHVRWGACCHGFVCVRDCTSAVAGGSIVHTATARSKSVRARRRPLGTQSGAQFRLPLRVCGHDRLSSGPSSPPLQVTSAESPECAAHENFISHWIWPCLRFGLLSDLARPATEEKVDAVPKSFPTSSCPQTAAAAKSRLPPGPCCSQIALQILPPQRNCLVRA